MTTDVANKMWHTAAIGTQTATIIALHTAAPVLLYIAVF